MKTHKYKAYRGSHDVAPDYVLPEGYHIDHHAKAMKKLDDIKKEIEKEFGMGQEEKIKEIKLTQEEKKDESSNIVIPGLTDKKEEVRKKPLIMEMK